MAAGIIDHETGSRDMRKLNGLWTYMPITATLAMVAAAAMAGVPLLNGFLSKEMFFAETLHQSTLGSISWMVPVFATIGGAFSVAYSLRFIHDVFFNGEPKGSAQKPHEPPRYMRVPVEILVALCLIVGVFPEYTVGDVLASASTVVLGGRLPEYHLHIWHGLNLPLLMSLFGPARRRGSSITTGSGSSVFKRIFRSTTRANCSTMRSKRSAASTASLFGLV
jgi:multicomponent K+:H+ antiporter subunit A